MINVSKLKEAVQKDGKIEAQCPACLAAGADSKGNHLVVYPDGKFGCVANPGNTEHNKTILKLIGEKGVRPLPQLQIRRQEIPASTVLMKVGRSGQRIPTPARNGANHSTDAPRPAEVTEICPSCPEPDAIATGEARPLLEAR